MGSSVRCLGFRGVAISKFQSFQTETVYHTLYTRLLPLATPTEAVLKLSIPGKLIILQKKKSQSKASVKSAFLYQDCSVLTTAGPPLVVLGCPQYLQPLDPT